jgi:DNA-directed RNA polymerase specialized sigma24 family protein
MKVYRNLDGFRFEAKLSTWIARIARNTCLNHLGSSLTVGVNGEKAFRPPRVAILFVFPRLRLDS